MPTPVFCEMPSRTVFNSSNTSSLSIVQIIKYLEKIKKQVCKLAKSKLISEFPRKDQDMLFFVGNTTESWKVRWEIRRALYNLWYLKSLGKNNKTLKLKEKLFSEFINKLYNYLALTSDLSLLEHQRWSSKRFMYNIC